MFDASWQTVISDKEEKVLDCSCQPKQQYYYETVYQLRDREYGMPDRKITEGIDIQDKRILTIGCGTAGDVWHLADRNVIVGLDYAANGLKVAGRHGVKGVVENLNLRPNLPFKSRSFDLVVLKDILEHTLDPLAILQDARRVLKDDGTAVISVPNHFYLPMRLRLLFGQGLIWKLIGGADHGRIYDEWNYMHIRFFTYKGFRHFLEVSGFHAQKWFWDFGTLAHYRNPNMLLEPQLWKKAHGRPLSWRGRIGLYVFWPLWKVFNAFFPRFLRQTIVSLAPGLLCAGFYVKCKKT